uniref:uncharacterized protein n=1 Tax=Centroberyx gerrardi TaxID=166262 RepID=UPI003AAD1FA1
MEKLISTVQQLTLDVNQQKQSLEGLKNEIHELQAENKTLKAASVRRCSLKTDGVREEDGGDIRSVREEDGGDIRSVREEDGGDIRSVREEDGGDIRSVREEDGGDIRSVREEDGGDIRSVREEDGGDIRSVREEHGGDIRSVREEDGGDIRSVREEDGGDIRSVREEHGGDIRSVREEHGGDIRSVREEDGGDIRSVREEDGGDIRSVREEDGGDIRSVREEDGGDIRSVREEDGGDIRSVREEDGGDIRSVREEDGGDIRSVREEDGGDIRSVREEDGGDIRSVREEDGGDIRSVREEDGGDIRSVREEDGGDIRSVREEDGGDIRSVREEDGGDIRSVREEHGGDIRSRITDPSLEEGVDIARRIGRRQDGSTGSALTASVPSVDCVTAGLRRPGFSADLGSQQTWVLRRPGFSGDLGSQQTWVLRRPGFSGDLGSQRTWVLSGPGFSGDLGSQRTWVLSRPGFSADLGSQETWVLSGPGFSGDLGSQRTWVLRRPGFSADLGSQQTWVLSGPGFSGDLGSQQTWVLLSGGTLWIFSEGLRGSSCDVDLLDLLDLMLSSPPTPPLPTSSPQSPLTSDPQHVTMETYWREVRSIEEEKEEEEEQEEEEEEEERNSMDEAELEEAWLTEAGLSSLVTGSSSGEGPAEALLSTLTRQQAATVKKRLDNYNQTLKKKNKQPIRDVRDVFTTPTDDSANSCPPPPSHCAESAPSGRYHTTTKTIRRNTSRVRPTFPSFPPFEDQLPEHPNSPTPSPTHTHTVSIIPSRRADWLVRDSPYSEGVAEHRRGGSCQDCLCFHGDNSDLPFLLLSPGQGLTSMEDLSSADLTRLGFISLIELSTFLNALGVQTKRTRPPRCRTREQTGLQTEGILRVPGSAARLKYLRGELDRCSSGFDWSAVRQADAAGLLKLFIRELPTPLLTHTHLSAYRAVLDIPSLVHQVQALQLLTLLLPEANRDTLRALLVFLSQVVSHQDRNRMSLLNVSMVVAPNLFTCRRRGNKHSVARQRDEMEEAVGGAKLVRLMITHQELLWTVPSFLLSQVRQMNQTACQRETGLMKTKRRLLRRKNDKNDKNQVTQLCEGVIRVHAPLHTKVSMAIQLDGQTRASDVSARFQSQNRSCLYEVGGNIGERRLHPDCVLLEVYHVNPQCDWVLKPTHI